MAQENMFGFRTYGSLFYRGSLYHVSFNQGWPASRKGRSKSDHLALSGCRCAAGLGLCLANNTPGSPQGFDTDDDRDHLA
jgi:hypothetical protein